MGPVGPVGRCGVVVSRPRRLFIDSRAASSWAASPARSPQRESARSARARQPRAASARSVARSRGGQISITASRPTPAARPQPASRRADRRDRRGHRDGQHEDQHRRGAPGGEIAVDHPGEQDHEPDHGHGPGGQPGVAGAGGAQRDQGHTADPEGQVGGEPAPRRPAERGEHQHGERSEGGEQRGLRLADHLVGEGEHRGHHDGRPRRALQRDQAGIVDEGTGYLHPLRSSSRSGPGRRDRIPEARRAVVRPGAPFVPGRVLFASPGPVMLRFRRHNDTFLGYWWQANGCKDRLQPVIRPPR